MFSVPAMRANGYLIETAALFASGSELSSTYSITAPWTFSAWVKTTVTGAEELILGATGGEIHINTNYTLEAEGTSSTALFRDPSAWMHIHVSNNGLFVNGVSHGSVTTTNLSNQKLFDDFEGYASEVHLKSGTDAVTNFYTTDAEGYINPKSATSGEHYFTFSNGADLGENSGSEGNWTATSVTQVSDTPTDSVTKGIGNNWTFSPSTRQGNACTLSNGNKTVTYTSTTRTLCDGTLPFNSGQYVAAFSFTGTGTDDVLIGWIQHPNSNLGDATGSNENPSKSIINNGGTGNYEIRANDTGTAVDTADEILVAIDIDAGLGWFGIYDDSAGTTNWWDHSGTQWRQTDEPALGTNSSASVSTTAFHTFCVSLRDSATVTILDNDTVSATLPSGFKSLATQNMPEVADGDLDAHWKTVTYTGNGTAIGSGGNAITGVGFTPDFLWIKNRDTANSAYIIDSIRGGTKVLVPDGTLAEGTQTEAVDSFDADGFTAGSRVNVNQSGDSHVAWCASLPNTVTSGWSGSPTITPTKEIYNATLGMSIVQWEGTGANASIPHSLGKKPFFIIFKCVDVVHDWFCYHEAIGNTKSIKLNSTAAATAASAVYFNNTDPTSTLITIGSEGGVNDASDTMVAYIFCETDFIKPISYTGNGNADGAFANLGISPEFMITKSSSASQAWSMFDNQRSPYNLVENTLQCNLADAEDTTTDRGDFVSNGWKCRGTGNPNTGSATYIGVAIGRPTQGGSKAKSQARGR
jgi:hypothetical protein